MKKTLRKFLSDECGINDRDSAFGPIVQFISRGKEPYIRGDDLYIEITRIGKDSLQNKIIFKDSHIKHNRRKVEFSDFIDMVVYHMKKNDQIYQDLLASQQEANKELNNAKDVINSLTKYRTLINAFKKVALENPNENLRLTNDIVREICKFFVPQEELETPITSLKLTKAFLNTSNVSYLLNKDNIMFYLVNDYFLSVVPDAVTKKYQIISQLDSRNNFNLHLGKNIAFQTILTHWPGSMSRKDPVGEFIKPDGSKVDATEACFIAINEYLESLYLSNRILLAMAQEIEQCGESKAKILQRRITDISKEGELLLPCLKELCVEMFIDYTPISWKNLYDALFEQDFNAQKELINKKISEFIEKSVSEEVMQILSEAEASGFQFEQHIQDTNSSGEASSSNSDIVSDLPGQIDLVGDAPE